VAQLQRNRDVGGFPDLVGIAKDELAGLDRLFIASMASRTASFDMRIVQSILEAEWIASFRQLAERHAAAATLTNSRSKMMEVAASINPSVSASSDCTRPCGIGRRAVRVIIASMSASYHMFRTPAEPAPAAMQRMARNPIVGWDGIGRAQESHHGRKHDERHHTWFHQRDIVADSNKAGSSAC
jgi:hypothetical protein